MIISLPPEIITQVLQSLPPKDVIANVSRVNKKLHDVQEKDEYWKDTCQNRYPMAKIAKGKKSWKELALFLEHGMKWNEHSLSLALTNKGYTLSCTTPSSKLNIGKGNRCFSDYGAVYLRCFEVTIDRMPESPGVPHIMVGLAPADILGKPDLNRVYGFSNDGKANGNSFTKEFEVGDRIGVMLNYAHMTVSFSKNDVLQGTPFVRLDRKEEYHPVVVFFSGGTQVTLVLPPRTEGLQMPLS